MLGLLLFLMVLAQPVAAQDDDWTCAANCAQCYGSAADQCLLCNTGYILLLDNTCAASPPATCPAAQLDAFDRVCKPTIYPNDWPCPHGTYNSAPSMFNASQACAPCALGRYCPTRGQADAAGPCAAGFYCKAGSSFEKPMRELATLVPYYQEAVSDPAAEIGHYCEPGAYCPAARGQGATETTPCDPGHYCPKAMMAALDTTKKCLAGYYCSGGAADPAPVSSSGGGGLCPKGHYCEEGSAAGAKCPPGTYQPAEGARNVSFCLGCPAGEHCATPGLAATSGTCGEGYYCPANQTEATPPAFRCRLGHECPTGSVSPKPCDVGKYTPAAGAASCEACPAGSYCSERSALTLCEAGSYCPGNDTRIFCPLGTYLPEVGRTSYRDCIQCPLAEKNSDGEQTEDQKVCTEWGLAGLSTSCAAGYACLAATSTRKPLGRASATTVTGEPEVGGMCTPGAYCPAGSSAPTTCPAGSYCPDFAAATPGELCEAGYLCAAGATTANPVQCPAGHYCPVGSSEAVPCPVGTYSSSRGAGSRQNCLPCRTGYRCLTAGLTHYNLSASDGAAACPAGSYCESSAGAADSDPKPCEPGYRCPGGTALREPCQPGTYQPQGGQAACEACPAGSYCEDQAGTDHSPCPKGYYCPENTTHGHEYPCPAGTYGTSTGLTAAAECTACPPGYYCEHSGAEEATGKILAGYFDLRERQTRPGPSPERPAATDPASCPRHFYCGEGTSRPTPCPDGLWAPWTESKSASDCIPCPRGQHCRFATLWADRGGRLDTVSKLLDINGTLGQADYERYHGPCGAGYVCLEGSQSSTPSSNGYPCPAGHMCPAGAKWATPCPFGTYGPRALSSTCVPCPAGEYCGARGLEQGTPCPRGRYCPLGSAYPLPCPAGTYGASGGLRTSAECTDCPAGQYCERPGATEPSGTCRAGFVCGAGASRGADPSRVYGDETRDGGREAHGKCPKGHECPGGKDGALAVACGTGTHNPDTGAAACRPCPPGRYCPAVGSIHSREELPQCDAGYYCSGGASSARQYGCSANKQCPAGSGSELPCAEGWWNPTALQAQCQACPSGSICADGAASECPLSKYCEDGTNYPYGRLCPSGTRHNADSGSTNKCELCPAGQFCLAGRVAGTCAPGYLCFSGAASPAPSGDLSKGDQAGPCPVGRYCPPIEPTKLLQVIALGTYSDLMKPCLNGTYTRERGAAQAAECSTCPAGHQCVAGQEPEPCPRGTYCPTGAAVPSKCPRGRYQPKSSEISGGAAHRDDCLPCPPGFYCDEPGLGRVDTAIKYKCPDGYFCPPGTRTPFACAAGTYSDVRAAGKDQIVYKLRGSTGACKPCREHFYCPRASARPTICPAGTYCPPVGRWAGRGYPVLCPAGKYCQPAPDGRSVLIRQCPEGFYCPVGSAAPIPCEKGAGCPPGSATPQPASIGPESCKAGEYFGYGACNPCEPGFVCRGQTWQRFPLYPASERGEECPVGNYCPRGSSAATRCPVGTYRSARKAASVEECAACPEGSFNRQTGQPSCTVCGRGARSNEARTACTCIGGFRTWRESTRTCVCQSGYKEPNITMESQTSTESSDCVPMLNPQCGEGEHRNDQTNECVPNSDCRRAALCRGQGESLGYYDATMQKCLCNDVPQESSAFCDAACQEKSLQAFVTNDGRIFLKVASDPESEGRYYQKSAFASQMLDGLQCSSSSGRCSIQNVDTTSGEMGGKFEAPAPFVAKWKETHPDYVSPYAQPASLRRELQEPESLHNHSGRILQASGSAVPSAIIVAKKGEAVSFETTAEHFPVYLKDSALNTDPNFDDGVFDTLKTKLTSSARKIGSLAYTFGRRGVYVFGDHADPTNSQTVVVINDGPAQILPLTAENLRRLGVLPQEPEMTELPASLAFIGPLFILLAAASLLAQSILELRIQKKEVRRASRKVSLRKEHDIVLKKDSVLQYLDDLLSLVKSNLAEVKARVQEGEDKRRLRLLLENKLNAMNEIKPSSKEELQEILEESRKLLDNLRFADGRSLKEALQERQAERALQQGLRQQSVEEAIPEESYDEEYDDEYDQEDDEEPEQPVDEDASVEQEEEDEASAEEEEESEGENKDQGRVVNEAALEALVSAEADVNRRKDQFEQNLQGVVDGDQHLDMVKELDGKLNDLGKELELAQKKQEDRLKARLAARGRKKKAAQEAFEKETAKIDQQVKNIENTLEALEDERDQLREHKLQLEEGIMNAEAKQELEKEQREEKERLDRNKEEKVKEIRDDYMERMRRARTSAEKERLLTEMQSKIKSVESELDRERKAQLKQLEKSLKERRRRRLQKQLDEKEAEIQVQTEMKEGKEEEKDLHQIKMYAEGEDLVPERLKEEADRLVDEVATTDLKFEITDEDKDQLDIVEVRHQTELEKAMKAVDVEIEDDLELERKRLEDKAAETIAARRKELEQQALEAQNAKERQAFKDQLKKFDSQSKQQLEDEQLKQARLLEERRKARQAQRKIRAMEVKRRQQKETCDKEAAINDQKLKAELERHDESVQAALEVRVGQIAQRLPGESSHKEQALIITNEAMDEASKRKLALLLQKQFFELQKYLSDLHTGVALDRVIAAEKIKAKYRDLMDEASNDLSGEALANRLDELEAQKKQALKDAQRDLEAKAREDEVQLRTQKEEKFYHEKEDLLFKDNKRKREMLEQIVESLPEEPLVQEVGRKLLGRLGTGVQEEITELEKEKDEKVEAAQCKLVASSEAEVREVQRAVDAQVREEEQRVEEAMQSRMDMLRDQRRRQLDERKKELLKHQDSMTAARITDLKEQYERELGDLEAAIRKEEAQQRAKLRKALLARKIAKERKKREAELEKKAKEEAERQAEEQRKRAQEQPTQKSEPARGGKAEKKKQKKERSSSSSSSSSDGKEKKKADGEDLLRRLLQKWAESIQQRKAVDFENVWDKQTIKEAPEIAIDGSLELASIQKESVEEVAETGQIGEDKKQVEFSVEELFRRMRRIEKLTRMIKAEGQSQAASGRGAGSVNARLSTDPYASAPPAKSRLDVQSAADSMPL